MCRQFLWGKTKKDRRLWLCIHILWWYISFWEQQIKQNPLWYFLVEIKDNELCSWGQIISIRYLRNVHNRILYNYLQGYLWNKQNTMFSFANSPKQTLNSRPRNFQLRKRTLLLIKDCYHHRCRHIRDTKGLLIYPSATSGSPFYKMMQFIRCHLKFTGQFIFTI